MSVSACLGVGSLTLLSTCACVHAAAVPMLLADSVTTEYDQAGPFTATPNAWDYRSGASAPYSHDPDSGVMAQIHAPAYQMITAAMPHWDTSSLAPAFSGAVPKTFPALYFSSFNSSSGGGAFLADATETAGGFGNFRDQEKGLVGTDSLLKDMLGVNSTFYGTAKVQDVRGHGATGARRMGVPRGHPSQQIASRQVEDKISKLFGLVLIPVFAMFGAAGNIMSLRVLSRLRMRNAMNLNPVLTALALSDLLFLLHALFFSFLKFYSLRDPTAGSTLRAVTFPILGVYSSVVTARITTGLTIMLSVERLVAVYRPIRAKLECSRSVTVAVIVLIYTGTVLMFAPYMFKYRAERRSLFHNQTAVVLVPTPLGKHPKFFPVYGTILNTLFRFLPLAVLSVVNLLIAKAIRKTWNRRQVMASSSSSCSSRSRGSGRSAGGGAWGGSDCARHNFRNSHEQTRITLMLLVVSLVSIVCILPGAVHSIMAQAWAPDYSRRGQQSNLYSLVGNVTYFLETVNSSVNFIIYMAFSANFKNTYRKMFCCRQGGEGAPGTSRGSARSVVHFSSRPHHNGLAHCERGRPERSNGSSSSSNCHNRESHPLRQWHR